MASQPEESSSVSLGEKPSLRYSGSSINVQKQREVLALKQRFPQFNSLRLSAALTFNENNLDKAVAMLEREKSALANSSSAVDEKEESQSGGSFIRSSERVELSDDEEENDEVFKSLRSLRRTYLPSTSLFDPRDYFRDLKDVNYRCVFNSSLATRFTKKWKKFKADYGEDSKEATPIVAYYDATGLTPKQMHSTLKHGPSVPSLFKRLTSGDKMAFGAGIYFIDDPSHVIANAGHQHTFLACAILPGRVMSEPGTPFDSLHIEEHRVLYAKSQILPLYEIDVTEPSQ